MPIAWRSLCASRLRPSMKSSRRARHLFGNGFAAGAVLWDDGRLLGQSSISLRTIHFEAARRRENHSRDPTSDDGRLIAVSWGVNHFTQAAGGHVVDEAAGHPAFW